MQNYFVDSEAVQPEPEGFHILTNKNTLGKNKIPKNLCVYGFYTSYKKFKMLNDTDKYKGFYAIRDPREILVSAYKHFILREPETHAHAFYRNYILLKEDPKIKIVITNKDFELAKVNSPDSKSLLMFSTDMPEHKRDYLRAGLHGGFKEYMTNEHIECEEERKQASLRAMIDILNSNLSVYPSMYEWAIKCNDNRILKIKNEDFLMNYKIENLEMLFDHLEIKISKGNLKKVYEDMRFENFSNGRKIGQEDNKHHYRSGTSDTWKKELNDETLDYFYKSTGKLIDVLEYER